MGVGCEGTHVWQQDLGQEAVLVRLDLQDQSAVVRILGQLRCAHLAYDVLAHHFVAHGNEPLVKPPGVHRGRQAWHRHQSVWWEAAAQSTLLRAAGPQQQRSGQCVERALHGRGWMDQQRRRARLRQLPSARDSELSLPGGTPRTHCENPSGALVSSRRPLEAPSGKRKVAFRKLTP